MKEKRDPKARALSAFKYWIKRCQDAGITKTEMRKVVNQMVNRKTSQAVNQMVNQAVNREEEEEGKRESPPHTPSIERSQEEGEETHTISACACESSSVTLDPKIDVPQVPADPKHPTLHQVLEFVKYHNKKQYSDELVREWYAEREFTGWLNKDGIPIKNWKHDLNMWRMFRPLHQKLADPDRIADARISRRNSEEESARQRQNDANAIAQQIIDARRKRNENV